MSARPSHIFFDHSTLTEPITVEQKAEFIETTEKLLHDYDTYIAKLNSEKDGRFGK